MDMTKKHRVYDTTAEEYILALCDELNVDGVSASQIWSSARFGFNFNAMEVREFAFLSIKALLDSGAVPAKPSTTGPDFFVPEPGYAGDSAALAKTIVSEWQSSSDDPDHGWHWFYRFSSNSPPCEP